jgi:ESCRT-II complex subunit VPS36
MPYYQSLSVQLTTHRLLFLHSSSSYASTTTTTSSSSSSPKSLQLSLSNIRQTEFYTGFMRSSPKISLFLGYPDPQTDGGSTFLDGTGTGTGIGGESWTCTVCGFVNEPKSLGNVSGKCSLCGVTRVIGNSGELSRAGTPVSGNSTAKSVLITDEVTTGRPGTPGTLGTLGIPSSSISPTSTSLNQIGQMEFAAAAAADDDDVVVHSRKETPCSRCTFLNHPSLSNCEICGSPLLVQRNTASSSTSSPTTTTTTTTTTTMTGGKQEGLKEVVRLSFRKGGEKEMYKRLKSVLEKKSWLGEVGCLEEVERRGLVAD